MSLSKVVAVATLLFLGMTPLAGARDSSGFLEPAENPLLGSWLLIGEQKNPNLPIGCSNLRLTFEQQPRTYMAYKPGQIAITQTGTIYTIIDHDHIKIDELTKCMYERGPPNGITPLIQSIETPATPPPAQNTAAPAAAVNGRHQMTYDEAIEAIGKLGSEHQ